jgi:Domain of unknown function (DUF4249)
MKKIIYSSFIATLLLIGCKKDIKLDLNQSASQIVIEGIVSDKNTTQTVTISKSVNFYENNTYPAVSGATVTISDNGASPVVATELPGGIYQFQGMTAVYGHTYYMSVTIAGTTYTAQSTMPYPVTLNDITFYNNNPGAKPDKLEYSAIPKYDDPLQYQNSYKFVQYDNGVKDNTVIVRNDNVTNGKTNEEPIFSRDFKIHKSDVVTVEMYGIDPSVYHYFFLLSTQAGSGPGGGTTPTNPESNISGGVLGYFSAQTYQSKTVTVP